MKSEHEKIAILLGAMNEMARNTIKHDDWRERIMERRGIWIKRQE